MVGDIKEWIDVLYSGNLDDFMMTAAAKEVGPGCGDADRVDGADGDVLAGLEPEGRTVNYFKEVYVGAGDAVGDSVVGQCCALRRHTTDSSHVAGNDRII